MLSDQELAVLGAEPFDQNAILVSVLTANGAEIPPALLAQEDATQAEGAPLSSVALESDIRGLLPAEKEPWEPPAILAGAAASPASPWEPFQPPLTEVKAQFAMDFMDPTGNFECHYLVCEIRGFPVTK